MNVKAGIVKTALEKKISFLNKTEILAKGEIRKCIIYKEQAETSHRHPEQHLENYLRRFLKGENSCVLHTVVCDKAEMPG